MCLAGCTGDDTDRLARVGRTVADKAEAAAGNADGKLFSGWQAVRGDLDQAGLAGRVSARLRWDKSLVDAKIEVSEAGTMVELKGTVGEPAQKQRALELAESTAGVEKVTDSLEVTSKDQ